MLPIIVLLASAPFPPSLALPVPDPFSDDGCGAAFVDAAAEELAPPPGVDCATARLLVVAVNLDDFEGVGSVLHSVVEARAEAYWSDRQLLWGPPDVAPSVFANVTEAGAGAWPRLGRPLRQVASRRPVESEESLVAGVCCPSALLLCHLA